MKNIFLTLILLMILFLGFIGFNYYKNYNNKINDDINTPELDTKKEEKEPEEEKKEEKIIPIGLYLEERSKRTLIKEFKSQWNYHNDISTFSVFYINEDEIPNQTIYKQIDVYKEGLEDIDNYRIGYKIKFSTDEGEIIKTIISPKDTEDFYNILEIYLYDDYHRNGEWYSHTTENDFNENTLLTSIKLTAGKEINKITSDIELSAFVYKTEELDNGNYTGNNIYTLKIINE